MTKVDATNGRGGGDGGSSTAHTSSPLELGGVSGGDDEKRKQMEQLKRKIDQLEYENSQLMKTHKRLMLENECLQGHLPPHESIDDSPCACSSTNSPIDSQTYFSEPFFQRVDSDASIDHNQTDQLNPLSSITLSDRMLNGPEYLRKIFRECEDSLVSYFGTPTVDHNMARIDIHGERYILVRSPSLSVEFSELIKQLLVDEKKAWLFTRSLLFDLSHAMGKSDCRAFARNIDFQNMKPIEQLCLGPILHSLTGWSNVTLLEECTEELMFNLYDNDQEFYSVYDHPNSFESEAYLRKGQTDVPVCICGAGYSSGWYSESFKGNYISIEILCKAKGDETCRFVLAHPNHIARRIQEYKDKHPELADRIHFDPDERFPSFFDRRENGSVVTVSDKAKESLDMLSHQYNLIQSEREKVTSLLNNILPEPIANEIAHGHKVKAEKRENACVLFADVANSVRIASSLTPEELVNWLNQIFDMFDYLTDKYGVEKIKTSGDCYVAATGILNDKSNKLDSMVDFCLEAIELLKEIKIPHTDEPVPMRFGLHSGQCMCGVIGHKKYHYDILGDTCNVSSRMEQLGEPGRLHVTQVIYNQLKDNPLYRFEERGTIEVKGKGTMITYWLTNTCAK